MCQIVKLKAAKYENNMIIWNAVCEDIDNAKALFTENVRHGLELSEVNFTISQYDRNRKFLKVTLNKKDNKFSIIKIASKLKDKTFHGNKGNLFICNDLPAEIRKICKLILVKLDKL